MLSPLRNRFGIPGLISVIALVFAMFGGAYAANNSSSDNSKASASAAKKGPRGPRGPKGATGPAGPAGPAGTAGSAGPQGPAGANGKDGTNGSDGADGVSVTTTGFEGVGGPCTAGGVELESASPEPAYVCNGKAGSGGGGTLPSKATETGVWADFFANESKEGFAPISFPVPLAAPLDAAHVISVPEKGTPPANCENAEHAGTASVANPEAKPGFLCVYTQNFLLSGSVAAIRVPSSIDEGAGTTGAVLRLTSSESEDGGFGTFAVTAP